MSYYGYYEWRPYVSAAARRRKAEREMEKLKKKGHPVSPVVIDGKAIASTFWGKAWCHNLERYSDFSNRLPRGRTYVRNGSVVDLQVVPGEVSAMVSGTDLYRVAVKVSAVRKALWTSICSDCAGAIDSLVELLQGSFSKGVMERICRQKTGLFPSPSEIEFTCSCPDWAYMCKHVAAVLYGIGARLDERPELLFKLRKVDEKDLIAKAGKHLPLSNNAPSGERLLAADGLSELFGLEFGGDRNEMPSVSCRTPAKPARPRRRAKPRPVTEKRPAKSARRRPHEATKKKTQKPKPRRKPRSRVK